MADHPHQPVNSDNTSPRLNLLVDNELIMMAPLLRNDDEKSKDKSQPNERHKIPAPADAVQNNQWVTNNKCDNFHFNMK